MTRRTPSDPAASPEAQRLLGLTVAEVRLEELLSTACATETADTSDAVQDIRLRVYTAGEAREEAARAYVAMLDARPKASA